MKNSIIHEGELDLNGLKIPCYVLESGTRVLSGRGMQSALKMVDEDEEYQTGGTRLSRHLNQKSLRPYIYKDKLPDHFKPLQCYKGERLINGYEATVLADICDGLLEARKHITLSPRQQIIAEQSEILIRSFAKVGIIALVDEATGYQNDIRRAKDALQQLLAKFLLKEKAAAWVKTFPDEFFEMIFKMKNWSWIDASKSKRPSVVGRYINDLVYKRLAPAILDELRLKNPLSATGSRKTKHHSWLTPDYGHPKLKEHLIGLVVLGRASGYDWTTFKRLVDRSYPRYDKDKTIRMLFQDGYPFA